MAERLALFGGQPVVDQHPDPWPPVTNALEERVATALRLGRLAYGANSVTRDLEDAFAAFHGRRFAIAANSGTSALMMGYHACGVGGVSCPPSAEPPQVIVPAYGFFATASSLLIFGADPKFCDVDPITGNLDPALVEACITPRTCGIAVTHVAGFPGPMSELCELAHRHGLFLLEDCSHAHGARLNGRLVGTFGQVAAFSFQAGKIVTGGEGGMLITDCEDALVRAACLGNFRRLEGTPFGVPPGMRDTGCGLKLRMAPLAAAMAHYFLDKLGEFCEMRGARLNELSEAIRSEAEGIFETPIQQDNVFRGAWYEYHLRLSAPGSCPQLAAVVRQALLAEGVPVRRTNTQAIHLLPLFGGRAGDFPVAERLTWSTIPLPTFTTEPKEVVLRCAEAVIKVARHIEALRAHLRRASWRNQ